MSHLTLLLSVLLQAAPRLHLTPTSARPGDVLFVEVSGTSELPEGTLGKRPLAFYPHGLEHYEALAPLPLELAAGPLVLDVKAMAGRKAMDLSATVDVTAGGFPAKELTVAGKFIEPPPEVRKQMAADREAFAKAFAQPLEPRVFRTGFAWPRPPVFNAHFGDQRLFNGHRESQHYGSDLAGKVGDPVVASNDGTVVMARPCYSSGNTVLLHHGAHAYTVYFHLSRIDVKLGERVKRGTPLGRVGKTGRVTGPHLHFGMKVDGLYVDPESMLRLTFP